MKDEKFSLDKFLDFSPVAWYTVFGLALKVLIFCLIVLGVVWVKNLLFPAAPQNVNQPNISVAEGGNLSYTVHQGKKERSWWVPTPFVEIYGFGEKAKDERLGVGAKGGLRWEF
jgi:hypothetical protein